MILFKEAAILQKHLAELKKSGVVVGFVPTMGALHSGHLSLIEKSKALCTVTVCSIFINPTQFNDPKDFEKYPVTISEDIQKLEMSGCDILFYPAVEEMYPPNSPPAAHYNLEPIEYMLEGKYRPGHFQGVCQIVDKLLTIIEPDRLFMGQKDYQQYLVIKKLVALIGKNVDVIKVNTAREASGLALSSRNLRLTSEEKEQAAGISKMLYYLRDNLTTANFRQLEKNVVTYLLQNGFRQVDYVSIADAETLQPVENSNAGKLVALIAASIGNVRLIDNLILNE